MRSSDFSSATLSISIESDPLDLTVQQCIRYKKPDIPASMPSKRQRVVDLIAYITNAPTGRISNLVESKLEMLISSDMAGNHSIALYKRLASLTPAEKQIAGFIQQGNTSKGIANIMNRTTSTIEFNRNNIRVKLGWKKF